MRYGLTEETLRKIEDVFRRHAEVDRVILYGSRAKGT
ncbi:MAG: nucleotidyltransferase domain-containing protein, partial [Bdellovibrionales bacterium]|nr:nucleotidyltransferase domain-containing protein [Bdellovibrionales bacterium]